MSVMEIVEMSLQVFASSLVGLWVLSSTFAMEIIHCIENTGDRHAGNRHLAPSAWQAIPA
ncbi:MAG: hypothetical protein ACM30I_00135 [Gemmatimonas sp.]